MREARTHPMFAAARRLCLLLLPLTVWLTPSTAAALTAKLRPLQPIEVGTTASFEVIDIQGAIGEVSLLWRVGEGEAIETKTTPSLDHVYGAVGRYSVSVIVEDAAGTRVVLRGVQKVHFPLTPAAPTQSSSIIFDRKTHKVWNVNPDNHSVTMTSLMGTDLSPLREVTVGKRPRSIAEAPDGTVWVTLQESWQVAVLDGETGDVLTHIAMPYASQPYGIAFGPDGNAYVSLFATGKVLQLDGAARRISAELAVGPTPAGVAISHDGRIFVTRCISPDNEGQVYELAAPGIGQLSLVRVISLGFDPGPDDEGNGRGVPNFISQIVISPDGTQAWVTAKKDNIARGPQRDGLSMVSDSFVRAITRVIDLQSNAERVAQRMDHDNRSLPVSVVFSEHGDYALVLTLSTSWVGFQNAYGTENLGGILDVGLAPDGFVLAPGDRLVVHGFLSRTLRVYDVSPVLSGENETAPEPSDTVLTVAKEALPDNVLAGKRIFHNSADSRMSREGYMACAACHLDGLHDGRVWDLSDRGEGLRNTRSLVGVRGGKGHGRVHWSANFDEIQDFERDIRESLGGLGFMPEAEWIERKSDPLALPSAGVSLELDQLAAYVESLTKVPPSPYRNADGTYTEAGKRGRKIYLRAACAACHQEPEFTDSSNNQLHDVGTLLPTSGSRLGGPLVGIDTPTLKGLWQTGPYLHDGRAKKLEDIFTQHNPDDKLGITSKLSEAELDDLVAYLLQIDDRPPPADMTWEPSAAVAPLATDVGDPASASSKSSSACGVLRHKGRGGLGGLCAILGGVLLTLRRRQHEAARTTLGPARRTTGRASSPPGRDSARVVSESGLANDATQP